MNNVVVVNEKDEVVGTMSREQAHKNGVPHRIAVVYLENEKREILVQVRNSGRFDHSAAGHVDPGETYLDAAKRELDEELGVKNVDLKEIGSSKSIDRQASKEINIFHVFKVFLAKAEPKKLQKEEVESTFWMNPLEILSEMKKDGNDDKYTGGFKASLKVYLEFKNKK